MKRLGIIGGLGPETGCNFCLSINNQFREKTNCQPDIVLENLPVSAEAEARIINGELGTEHLELLSKAVRRMNQAEVDLIVIPCNSIHIFIDKVRNAVSIPVLSIVEETVKFLKEKDITEVGILATSATLRKKLYEDKLLSENIKIHTPSSENQNKMGEIINNLVHSRHNDEDKLELAKIIKNFTDKEVKTILLACTDLQLITPEVNGTQVYDTMRILIDATMREILS